MTKQPKVTLFIQCLVDAMYPEAADAMVHIFDRLNVPITYPPEQTCCGQPAFNSGYRKEATKAALRFLDIFEASEVIVCPSGSCVHMVKKHYPELLAEDESQLKRAKAVAAKIYEFSEFLTDKLHIDSLNSAFPHSVTYHDSCHLKRGLGISSPPRVLLENVEGLNLIEMKESDTCCGFGGTFSVHYPDISTAMVDAKIDNIIDTGAEVVTGCDISCLMNIQGRLSRRGEKIRVMHIAEILACKGETSL